MKLLLIGHVCSPHSGSEPGGTWNWAWQLSRNHDVWVVAHPHDRTNIERFLAQCPNPRMAFHWVSVPRWIDPLDPRGSGRGLKLHYWIWLRLAYEKAATLHKEISFDVVHHLCWGSVSAPSPFWKLPIPFIWGPLGGAQQAPASFRRYFGRAWNREVLRSVRLRVLRFSPFLRITARASRVALATNHETADLLKVLGARDVRLWLDSGIPSEFIRNTPISEANGDMLTLLWVGRMLPRKALPLALEALAEARDVRARLVIAGDGEMRQTWEECAKTLHLESKVEFLGAVPWTKMPALYRSADALLFTSLRDSYGMQVLEAMGHGLPILTLHHQGVGTFVPPDAGIKVPVTNPHETVRGIVSAIRQLALNPETRRSLGNAGRAFAETQTWERRAKRMSELYEEVLSARRSPNPGSRLWALDRDLPASVKSHN
jgi:glycosyltransferase involved in cell wall biosynthesis